MYVLVCTRVPYVIVYIYNIYIYTYIHTYIYIHLTECKYFLLYFVNDLCGKNVDNERRLLEQANYICVSKPFPTE